MAVWGLASLEKLTWGCWASNKHVRLRHRNCMVGNWRIIVFLALVSRLLAAHGLTSCLSVRTQPLTATGAPSQTSTIPYHTIPVQSEAKKLNRALDCPKAMRRHMGTSSTTKGRSSPTHYLNTVSSPAVPPGGRKAALHGTNVFDFFSF